MCGISAVIDTSRGPTRPADNLIKDQLSTDLHASLDRIAHRGPDSRGHWTSNDGRIALGHVRLAINDLSEDGAQPVSDVLDQVHAVVNGELYDHDRLRVELAEQTGYQFKGHSDSELVVALYLHHGLSFLQHLRGEFALCLYDQRTRFFVAARDRYGIKPLFYTRADDRVLIAAEAKAFLPLGWRPQWDVQSLMELGWGHDQRTLFRGVSKLRPGHYMTINASGDIESCSYWDIEYADKNVPDPRSEVDIVASVRESLVEAVRLRLRADVPIGVYLSGGIDSSAIAGIVTHLVRERGEQLGSEKELQRVSCFSIAFDEDSGFDESAIANRTASFLNVQYYKKHMNESELARRFEDAVFHCEHHNPDLNFVGKFALSEEPRAHGYKVVLTGEGADEIFGGYPMYLPDFLREPDRAWSTPELANEERERLCDKLDAEIGAYYASVGADGTNRDACVARRQLNNITTVASMAAFAPKKLWAPWTRRVYPNVDPRTTIANNMSGAARAKMMHKWHPLHSAQYAWIKGNLVNQFLSCLGDRTEMAHSVEARTPFLDHHLTTLVDGLPPSLKIKHDATSGAFTQKHLLREAVRPFVTDEVYRRAKHPYSAPTTWPRNGSLHKLIGGLVTRENVAQLGFVDWAAVEGVVDAAFGEQGDAAAMRTAFVVAEWIVLAQRFGIPPATAADCGTAAKG